ncbi:30S ribosomal protein S1 [Galdieria sulphuraria]|uniref:RNA-binding S1 domain-containing protein n=1 Tax=Galdieria sulphuraria TaxID=130081 RepID=M2VTC3_GALSU|nr:RNA-binding S1 domain-containing protein [Galdieria sulphuraria]EME26441.1 RNA-binding S1 domain-containing protein [Galdieria sulphuraria]GJD12321.1 30S ribosomal protein S1 [Galdieria sulphuraria]|eukprot:XP_005702961.1 RNA-binding S1 domain-containing protein [Galdieria sulphuraria]
MKPFESISYAFLFWASPVVNTRLNIRKKFSNRKSCFCSVLQNNSKGNISSKFQNEEPTGHALDPPKVLSLSKATINFDQLYLGQELTAKILKQKAYGCFVDIGLGQDVLVHISELSTQFVKNILETVTVGDTITVYVKSIDSDSRKVWLTTLKYRQFVSRRKPLGEVRVEDIVKGNIVRLTDSGAFVDFGCICDGFLPFTEVPREGSSNLALGDEVETRVTRIDERTRKIWLSIRQVDSKIRNLIRPPLELVLERPSIEGENPTEVSANSNETESYVET